MSGQGSSGAGRRGQGAVGTRVSIMQHLDELRGELGRAAMGLRVRAQWQSER